MDCEDRVRRSGTSGIPAALATTGILTAFGASACYALPLFLASFGLSTAFVAQIGAIAAPYRHCQSKCTSRKLRQIWLVDTFAKWRNSGIRRNEIPSAKRSNHA